MATSAIVFRSNFASAIHIFEALEHELTRSTRVIIKQESLAEGTFSFDFKLENTCLTYHSAGSDHSSQHTANFELIFSSSSLHKLDLAVRMHLRSRNMQTVYLFV